MPRKSLFRQPGTQHFQLVHRSQRDPLIHDPDASQRVLKAFERGNVAKGKSRAELEKSLLPSELIHDKERANIGEAATYGVYFDDTDYDYMQHLRPVGLQEAGVDSILVEAPTKAKGKDKSKSPIELLGLPPGVLPSTSELPRNYEAQQNIPSSIAGFQPNLDPHLRQTLEALEDDAFVDDDLDDNFFGELVGEGELGPNDYLEYEYKEEGVENDALGEAGKQHEAEVAAEEDEEAGWEARFAKFQRAQKEVPRSDASDIDHSEDGDTVGALPQLSVIGGRKRRKESSDASGYSMSSSSMFRNEGLTMLDERFEEMQKQYDSDEEQADEEDGQSDDSDEAPKLITTREDFDAMMNEFLDNYEILGGKMRPVLPGCTATEKLDTVRKGLGEAHLRDADEEDGSDGDDILMPLDIDNKLDRWDCETVLTTYSNLENHPRLIKARQDKHVPKIRLHAKTGLPVVDDNQPQCRVAAHSSESNSADNSQPQRVTIVRPLNESKEDKKARKQAVKIERQHRRSEKKATKEQFTSEAMRQNRTLAHKEKTKARKL